MCSVLRLNSYAQTPRKCRSAGRSAQTSFGLIGFRLFAQRSGTAYWMRCQFGDAVAGCPATWRREGFASTLFSRSPTEAGPGPAERLVASALAGSQGAWLSHQSVDHSPHCRVIQHEFGVQYHRDHVGRLMHSLQWSPQKPERRALERDERAIERWKQKRWPRIKKRCAVGRPPSICR